ncbi:E3 ubiquitin-protein ligase spl2 [Thalictrum thalictroides]|uniref:RING-type E3 ubiquitin transferase n=1 Tax=Thalictrum thalictroides TaxID=46969 RepID=A0A7J6WQG5_THATH|nr:E3 ubiquitin-protein ligase spl2 [Thalictrum thalictroides]
MSTENNNNNRGSCVYDVLFDVSLTAVALTFGWKYLYNSLMYKILDINLTKLEKSVQLPISDLRSFAAASESGSDNPLVVVRGFIKPLSSDSPPIISQCSGMEGVLLERIQTSKLNTSNMFMNLLSSLTRQTIQTVDKVPFVLVQKGSSDSVVINMNEYQHKIVDLTQVYNQVQPTIIKFLGLDFSGVKHVEEKMLLVGKEIIAFGNVFVSKDGVVEIKHCRDFNYFLSRDRSIGAMQLDFIWKMFELNCCKKIYGYSLIILLICIIFSRRNRLRWEACFNCLKHKWQVWKQYNRKNNVDSEESIE